jgi:hypothetical protein
MLLRTSSLYGCQRVDVAGSRTMNNNRAQWPIVCNVVKAAQSDETVSTTTMCIYSTPYINAVHCRR